jgi:hypothetical protein
VCLFKDVNDKGNKNSLTALPRGLIYSKEAHLLAETHSTRYGRPLSCRLLNLNYRHGLRDITSFPRGNESFSLCKDVLTRQLHLALY